MYTKGKWTVHGTIIQDDSGYPIAQVWPVTRLSKDYPGWNEADARLIAAAPELLEACKVAEIVLRQGLKVDKDGNPENNQSHRAWKIANAAIEAAESEV